MKHWGENLFELMKNMTIVFEETEEQDMELLQEQAFYFFQSLKYLMPCKDCRDHYTKLFDKYPITKYLNNKINLRKWIYIIESETKKNQSKHNNKTIKNNIIKHTNSNTNSNSNANSNVRGVLKIIGKGTSRIEAPHSGTKKYCCD